MSKKLLKLDKAFSVRLTLDQASDIFRRPKPKNRTWGEHYIYLTEVSHSAGGMDKYVLDGIVKYASAELKAILVSKCNEETTDYLMEAGMMANVAQSLTMEERPARVLGRQINQVDGVSVASVEEVFCS